MPPPRLDFHSFLPSNHNKINIFNLLCKHLLFSTLLYKISLFISKNIFIARCFSIIILVYMQYKNNFKKIISSSSLFAILKGSFVFFPLLIYTNYKYIFNIYSKNTETKFFTFILAINILIPAIMLSLNSNEKLSKLNGIYLIVLALLTPKIYFNYKTENISFTQNKLWCIACSLILTSTYLFNDFYYKMNWRYPGLYSVIIPTIHTLFYNDSILWLPIRVYSLIITFIINLNFPFIEKELSKNINSKILWSTDKYDSLKFIFSIFEFIITILLIKQGHKDTFLNYFYK